MVWLEVLHLLQSRAPSRAPRQTKRGPKPFKAQVQELEPQVLRAPGARLRAAAHERHLRQPAEAAGLRALAYI